MYGGLQRGPQLSTHHAERRYSPKLFDRSFFSGQPQTDVLNEVQFLMATIISQLFYFIYFLLYIFESHGRIATILLILGN